MVSLFSRFSVSRSGHRRTQSAADEREVLPPASEVLVIAPGNAAGHGIEVAVEFKPVEHPIEPLDSEQPVQCPLPEPSILNDGRMWKDRLPASMRRQGDLPVVKDSAAIESDDPVTKPPRLSQSNRMILPSLYHVNVYLQHQSHRSMFLWHRTLSCSQVNVYHHEKTCLVFPQAAIAAVVNPGRPVRSNGPNSSISHTAHHAISSVTSKRNRNNGKAEEEDDSCRR